MKKTKNIEGALLMSVAVVALQGCSSREYTRRCVDDKGNLIPDSACTSPTTAGRGYISPHWIYVHGGTRYSGSRVMSGFETSQPDATVRSSSGTVINTRRSGFGSSSGSFGG